jgi:MoaA/NifB/PqqE/SkfB family radical SAM enzyme
MYRVLDPLHGGIGEKEGPTMESKRADVIGGFFQSVLRRMNPLTAMSLGAGYFAAAERRRRQSDVIVPQAIAISVTSRCNLSCPGCPVNPIDPDRRELSTEELRRFIRESKELGVYIYFILGGEPFTRADLLPLMAAEKDAFFMVFTNATLLDENIVAAISKCPNILPMLSLEGFRESTDRWRGAGTFDKVMNAMALLSQRGAFFGYSTTVTSLNREEISSEPFVRAMFAAGCRVAYHSGYVAVGEEAPRQYQLSVNDRRTLKEAVSKLAEKYNIAFISENLEEACIGGAEYLHISPYGDAEPCPAIHHSTHNVRQHTLVEIMESRIMREMRDAAESLAGAAEACVFRSGKFRRLCGQDGRPRDCQDTTERLPRMPVPLDEATIAAGIELR